MRLLALLLLALTGFTPPAQAGKVPPAVPVNRYGLPVVTRSELYRQQVRLDRGAALVDVGAFVPRLRVRLAYATADNPTHRILYDARRAYLRLPAALALREAQRELARHDLGLLVFDAYRPYRATLVLWLAVHDSSFAAPPWSGSRHNRGAALDLTLVDLETGRQLPMPTPYDTFSPRAAHGFTAVSPSVAHNRDLLRRVMQRHGFLPLEEEWWHYDFGGWRGFALMDLPLSAVAGVPPRADVWREYPPAARLALLAAMALRR